ncbi:WhiB family transcriptional regulator [Streptomyces sp. NPDC088739]|uniref:WhiB family transcriptional regulator n=1 Tax=Streptomyces sp. NPDC088739 TaxID=3365882 RepID=UPI0037FDE975
MALARAIRALGPDVFLPCWSDADDWFSVNAADRFEAVRRCGRCPVRGECLGAAVARGEKYGVWGGVQFPAVPSTGAGR